MLTGILLFLMLSTGCYWLLTEYIIFPSLRTEKLYGETGGQKKQSWIDHMCAPLAARLEKHILMSDYKKEKLSHTLRTIGETRSANRYVAEIVAQAMLVVTLGVITLPLYPFVSVCCAIAAVVLFVHEMQTPEKQLRLKRERIERELPRFASTISNSLSASRDVVKILENYRKVCGVELAGELDVTLADMKTGNTQNALRDLENRLKSAKLSELVRGLLSVVQGEDQTLYFYTKNVEFRREYMEYQKREIQRRPEKLMPFIIGIVVCYMLMLLYIIGNQIMSGGQIIF